MSSPKPPRFTPQTTEGKNLLNEVDKHAANHQNPHQVKVAQLADLVLTGAASGDVVTLQADGTYKLVTPPGSSGGAPVGSATPLSATGAGTVGVATSAAREDHRHPSIDFTPADHGATGWSVDPARATTTLTTVAGTLYLALVPVIVTGPISTVQVTLSTQGAGLTGAWVAVYSTTGTLLGVSADQSSGWSGSAGDKAVTLTSPTASIPAGTRVLVGFLTTGGTPPVVRAVAAAASLNTRLSGTSPRRLSTLAGLTAVPSPVDLSATASATTMPVLIVA